MNDKSDQRLRLTLRQLEAFVAIARAGTARAGAERIARSQSAASAALAELEAALGVTLFERSARRLRLNEQGRALLPQAAALLGQAAELEALFDSGPAAPLSVAASLTIGEYLLPGLLAAWQRAHPRNPVRLQIANTAAVTAALAAHEADVGFIEGPQAHPALRVLPWLTDELVIVAAPAHPLAAGPVGRAQLAAATWILREPGSGTRQATDQWLLGALGTLQVAFELGSTEAIKRLAMAGAGVACLSRHTVAEALEQGRLVELRTRLPAARRRLAVVLRRDQRLGRVAQDFVAFGQAWRPGAVP